jgi:hypothetical protein
MTILKVKHHTCRVLHTSAKGNNTTLLQSKYLEGKLFPPIGINGKWPLTPVKDKF